MISQIYLFVITILDKKKKLVIFQVQCYAQRRDRKSQGLQPGQK